MATMYSFHSNEFKSISFFRMFLVLLYNNCQGSSLTGSTLVTKDGTNKNLNSTAVWPTHEVLELEMAFTPKIQALQDQTKQTYFQFLIIFITMY